MSKCLDDYRMTPQEIEELRQDTKEALKSPTYLALLSQIKSLDLSKERASKVYYSTTLPFSTIYTLSITPFPKKPR